MTRVIKKYGRVWILVQTLAGALLILSSSIPAWADDLGFYCYPNPARLHKWPVTFAFAAGEGATGTIEIYTIDGVKVKVIDFVVQTDGANKVSWGFKNIAGDTVIPGVYLAVLRLSDAGEKVDKLVFVLE